MSETLTQMLARNPLAGANLASGDAFRVLDVSGTELGKDAMITAAELCKALLGYGGSQTNSSGNTTVTPVFCNLLHTEIITFSGAGSTTRQVILSTASMAQRGAHCLVRCLMPATADITVEFHSGAPGTPLTSFVTDATGDDKVAMFYSDGSAWNFLRFDSYATA